MARSHTLAPWAAVLLAGIVLAAGGCASLNAQLRARLTPAAIHHDATVAYIAVATGVQLAESGGVSLPDYNRLEQARLDAWKGLQAERMLWALSGPHPATALDAEADSLRPPGL